MNVMTRYSTGRNKVAAQVAALQEFEQALKDFNNRDIKFTAYQLQENINFCHITYIKDQATAELLMKQDFYKKLGDDTLSHCQQAPSFSLMDMVATFKLA
ncbi:MAG: hypothetical protein ACJAYG_001997 [Oceanicoccus sp.]|jgi:hypothetical protein